MFSRDGVYGDGMVRAPRENVDGRFIAYALNATDYAQFIEGSTRDKLTQSAMKAIPILTPSLLEQAAIAAFLDRETAKTDALVSEQKRLVDLLKKKRQSVIFHAVTTGIDPSVPMKDSKIEWLGKVPVHWQCEMLCRVADRIVVGIAEAATHAYTDVGVPIRA